jgi:hypothetical protein
MPAINAAGIESAAMPASSGMARAGMRASRATVRPRRRMEITRISAFDGFWARASPRLIRFYRPIVV